MFMRKTALFLCALLSAGIAAFGQAKSAGDWQDKPTLHTIPAEYAGSSAVIIEEHTIIKYQDEEDKDLWMHRTYHRIIKILDEKGIEDFNKMSVSVYPGEVMEALKARTILANGTVIEVSKDKMKEAKGDDGNTEISFAMDGIEKNAEVELWLSYKKPASLFGKEIFQFSIPVMEATFELSSPKRLKFEEKGYNGFPTVSDTLTGSDRYIYAEYHKIPAIQEEAYSYIDINRMLAEYKVSYLPEEHDNVRVYTWQDLAKRLYSNTYQLSDREDKAVEKYLADIGVAGSDNEEAKIKKIESAIKGGITLYKEISDDDAWKLDNVIGKKSATESGIIRLFAACFFKAGVKHELGISTNRSLNIFDPEFENWNALENYLFYFPTQKKFLSPAAIYYRYPYTTTDVLNNKGMFCKLTTLGDITNAIADIRSIPPVPTAENHNDIVADISFNTDMEANVEFTYSFSGYCAMGIREAVVLLPKEKIKEFAQNILTLADKPENLLKYTISGEAFDNYYTGKPVQFVASIKAPQLVEKAGPKYLFKIGDVIGRQSELYQTAARKLPIDLEYPHYLNRTITVNIPEGYKILNPETIKIQTDLKDENGKVTTAFYSDYKIESNKLTVNISEFYSQLHFPVADYEAFRKVINASADFNKVTLLLGKM